jgi:hypothetical protein
LRRMELVQAAGRIELVFGDRVAHFVSVHVDVAALGVEIDLDRSWRGGRVADDGRITDARCGNDEGARRSDAFSAVCIKLRCTAGELARGDKSYKRYEKRRE